MDSAVLDRILIVDDDADTRFLLESVLQNEGFQAETAESGERALELLSEDRFDLVLTDKKMSGVDGTALLSEIWRRYPRIGTAMISGYRNDDGDAQASSRVLAYFEKPIYDLRQVAVTLKSVLHDHRRKLSDQS